MVRLFALFHDSKRVDDGYDGEHGLRGAEFAKECYENKMLDITEEQFKKLYDACRLHTVVGKFGDVTIDTCFDSDRLDLGRVGFKLNPLKMATSMGAEIAKKSNREQIDPYRMREWIKNLAL